jgi:ABC-type glycerol-3-phosphate transport system permease component
VFTAAILTFFFAWNDFVFGISLTATNNPGRCPRRSRSSPVSRSSSDRRPPSRRRR